MLRDDLLTRLLAVALVVALAAVVSVAVAPDQTGRQFTEFYLLNESGVAANYPDSLSVGETGTVAVGISNRRQSPVTHAVVVTFADRSVAEYGRTLAARETHERPVSFRPERSGEFLLRAELHAGDEPGGDPEQTLRLHVTVHDGTPTPERAIEPR